MQIVQNDYSNSFHLLIFAEPNLILYLSYGFYSSVLATLISTCDFMESD